MAQNIKVYFILDYKIWLKLHCRKEIRLFYSFWYVDTCLRYVIFFHLWQLIIFLQKDEKTLWSLLNFASSVEEVETGDSVEYVEVSFERVMNKYWLKSCLWKIYFIIYFSVYYFMMKVYYFIIYYSVYYFMMKVFKYLFNANINLMQTFNIDSKEHSLHSKTFYFNCLIWFSLISTR